MAVFSWNARSLFYRRPISDLISHCMILTRILSSGMQLFDKISELNLQEKSGLYVYIWTFKFSYLTITFQHIFKIIYNKYCKESKTRRVQRPSCVKVKFSKKLKLEARTWLLFCTFLTVSLTPAAIAVIIFHTEEVVHFVISHWSSWSLPALS